MMIVLLLLLAHLIADFWLQTDCNGKKQDETFKKAYASSPNHNRTSTRNHLGVLLSLYEYIQLSPTPLSLYCRDTSSD